MPFPPFQHLLLENLTSVFTFIQGTNGAAQPITAFDCNQYTSQEKQGCPRPSPAGAGTFGTYSFFPFIDSGSTRNIPFQVGSIF